MAELNLAEMDFEEAVAVLVAAGVEENQARFIVAMIKGEIEGDVIMEDPLEDDK